MGLTRCLQCALSRLRVQSAQGSLQVLSRRSCSLVQQRAVQREVTPAFSGAVDQHPCLPCAVEPCVCLSADRSQVTWLTQANSTTFIQLFLCLETRKGSALNPVTTWGFVTVQVSRPSRVKWSGSQEAAPVHLPSGLWTPSLLGTQQEPGKVPLSQNLSSNGVAQKAILLAQNQGFTSYPH